VPYYLPASVICKGVSLAVSLIQCFALKKSLQSLPADSTGNFMTLVPYLATMAILEGALLPVFFYLERKAYAEFHLKMLERIGYSPTKLS